MKTEPNIIQLIPHRYPFLFIDEVVEYKIGHWIEGIKRVSRNDRLHLVTSPLLLCESLAQLSKVLESLSGSAPQNISYLASLQIDFFEQVSFGDEIRLYAGKEKEFNQMVCYYVKAKVQEKIFLEGTLIRKQIQSI